MKIGIYIEEIFENLKKGIVAELKTHIAGVLEPPPQMMTGPEVRNMLRISKGQLQILRQKGRFPYFQEEKHIKYRRSDVLKYIKEHMKNTVSSLLYWAPVICPMFTDIEWP